MIGTKARQISNSSLDWVKLGPRIFKMMWDRELKTRTTASLDLGSAVHCYILEPDRFKNDYVIVNVKPVKGLMGDFIRAVHNLSVSKLPLEDVTEEEYAGIASAVGFKIPIERVLKEYAKPEYDDYKKNLEDSIGKLVISEEDYNIIVACKASVSSHKLARTLVLDELPGLIYENELRFEGIAKGKYMDLPSVGIFDRLIIDHEGKKITLVDLKTTSSSAYMFRDSYAKYNYDRQMAFYYDLIKNNWPDYDVEVYIVAIQTTYVTHSTDCVVYGIDEVEVMKGRSKYIPLIDTVSWHMRNDIWDYPQSYYESIGVCQINPDP